MFFFICLFVAFFFIKDTGVLQLLRVEKYEAYSLFLFYRHEKDKYTSYTSLCVIE